LITKNCNLLLLKRPTSWIIGRHLTGCISHRVVRLLVTGGSLIHRQPEGHFAVSWMRQFGK